MEGNIKHSKTTDCYELTVNGRFYGSYDTFKEALEAYMEEIEKEAVVHE